jgi:hypothetical protein
MRRDFRLPEADEAFLNGRGLPWETAVDGSQRLLHVHDWPIPNGYNHPTVTAAVMIPPSYPDAGLDMVYFCPGLARLDGQTIPATVQHQAMGRAWQRWSRHYTSANPWRVGEDDLSTHFTLVEHWLTRELARIAA